MNNWTVGAGYLSMQEANHCISCWVTTHIYSSCVTNGRHSWLFESPRHPTKFHWNTCTGKGGSYSPTVQSFGNSLGSCGETWWCHCWAVGPVLEHSMEEDEKPGEYTVGQYSTLPNSGIE
jgi:hypothetical protein